MFQDTYIISLIIYPVKQQNVKTASYVRVLYGVSTS